MHPYSVMSNSFLTPWTVAWQTLLSMEFSKQEYWSGLPFLFPGDLPDPRIEPQSPTLQGRFFTIWATREAYSILSNEPNRNKGSYLPNQTISKFIFKIPLSFLASHLHHYSCIETILYLAVQTWPSPASYFTSLASPYSLSACTINPLLGLSPSLTLFPSPDLSYQILIWHLYLYILICIFNLKWSLLLAYLLA